MDLAFDDPLVVEDEDEEVVPVKGVGEDPSSVGMSGEDVAGVGTLVEGGDSSVLLDGQNDSSPPSARHATATARSRL